MMNEVLDVRVAGAWRWWRVSWNSLARSSNSSKRGDSADFLLFEQWHWKRRKLIWFQWRGILALHHSHSRHQFEVGHQVLKTGTLLRLVWFLWALYAILRINLNFIRKHLQSSWQFLLWSKNTTRLQTNLCLRWQFIWLCLPVFLADRQVTYGMDIKVRLQSR